MIHFSFFIYIAQLLASFKVSIYNSVFVYLVFFLSINFISQDHPLKKNCLGAFSMLRGNSLPLCVPLLITPYTSGNGYAPVCFFSKRQPPNHSAI